MSGTQKPPEGDAPADVHVDTPEQAEARQLVTTNQRVTHVARDEEEVGDVPDAEAFSLTLEDKKGKKKTVQVTKPATAQHATKDKS